MFNLDLLKGLLPFTPMLSLTGDEGGGKGEEGEGNDGGGKGAEGTVSKADYDLAMADLEKTKTDLEDMRMEVLTPDYLDYLNSGKSKGKEKEEVKDEGIKDDDLEKLSKKEILALAEKKADEKIKSFEASVKGQSDETTRKEVAAFSRTHQDYKTYRPIMYGLSLDPKNKDLSLEELYIASKEHVKGIHTETTTAEKERQKKSMGEKPGGSSESFEELKKLSSTEATKSAADEVSAKLGAFPDA